MRNGFGSTPKWSSNFMEKLKLKCSGFPSGNTWFHVWKKDAKEGDRCLCGNSIYHDIGLNRYTKNRAIRVITKGDLLMKKSKSELVLYLRNSNNRLKEIHGIIDVVEQRCLCADGPVTKTHNEITDEELRQIYKLSEI